MLLYSTQNKRNTTNLKTAVLQSMPEDKGLYMPVTIPVMENSFFENIVEKSFEEISFRIAEALIDKAIPNPVLEDIITDSINFSAPVKMISESIGVLELFHGPSLAFKDFGARFMSRLMGYYNRNEDKKLTILVATSGDTGGAVAAGFYKTEGIEVVILYPSGKVSELQEKQLTTLGENIIACEIQGSFDDCQAMVKRAFLDPDLNKVYRLSSANSINIARLIPQTFYYFEAWKQVKHDYRKKVFSVPSGNFGNLTAGLMAKRMGLPIDHFIAATNVNKVVPDYLKTGTFSPVPSISTISNAMDVGDPSNFARMMDLYSKDHDAINKDVTGFFCDDETTKDIMRRVFHQYQYILDPHGAIGYASLEEYLKNHDEFLGIFLETAHPGKFLPVVEGTLGISIPLPDSLNELYSKLKNAEKLSSDYSGFREFMLSRKRR